MESSAFSAEQPERSGKYPIISVSEAFPSSKQLKEKRFAFSLRSFAVDFVGFVPFPFAGVRILLASLGFVILFALLQTFVD